MTESSFNENQGGLTYIYELLLRRVYHCSRGNDPFGLVDSDQFSSDENGRLRSAAYVGIWTALIILQDQIIEENSIHNLNRIRILFEQDPSLRCFERLCPEIFKLMDENRIEEFPHWKSIPYKV